MRLTFIITKFIELIAEKQVDKTFLDVCKELNKQIQFLAKIAFLLGGIFVETNKKLFI